MCNICNNNLYYNVFSKTIICSQTIFEINSTSKADGLSVMKKKRDYHSSVIDRATKKTEEKKAAILEEEQEKTDQQEQSTDTDIKVQNVLKVYCGNYNLRLLLKKMWSFKMTGGLKQC